MFLCGGLKLEVCFDFVIYNNWNFVIVWFLDKEEKGFFLLEFNLYLLGYC